VEPFLITISLLLLDPFFLGRRFAANESSIDPRMNERNSLLIYKTNPINKKRRKNKFE
jgi:hypothetical protein